MSGKSKTHQVLIDAFLGIRDPCFLGWAALDTKVERFVVAAIAAEINRRHGRIAHIEFPPRTDLVVLESPIPSGAKRLDPRQATIKSRYEAKAGQLFDFAPAQRTSDGYMGGHLNDDMAVLRPGVDAGLFFIADVDDPTRHLKYFKGHAAPSRAAALKILQSNVPNGRLVADPTLDCGSVDGTKVRIHMCVFERV